MQNRTIAKGLFAAVCLLLLAGCSTSTKLTENWSSPAYAKKLTGQKVMVMAIAKRPDLRRTFENEFVKQLQQAGVSAAPSYEYIAADGRADLPAVKQAVARSGVDSVLVLRLLGSHQDQPNQDQEFGAFMGYYNAAWAEAQPQQYAFTVYTTDARLFDVKQDKLVWSGKLETKDPNNIDNDPSKIAQEYAGKVVQALKEGGPA